MSTTRTTTTRRLAAAATAAVLGLGTAACATDDTIPASPEADEEQLEDPGDEQVGTDDPGDPAGDGDELD